MTVEKVRTSDRMVARSAHIALPPAKMFEIVATPRAHHKLDGSGTVGSTVTGPARLSLNSAFTTHMKQFGFPYKITSRVTRFEEGKVIEWRHPLGHRWRYEFAPEGDGTRVTETFDYSDVGALKAAAFQTTGVVSRNAEGITATLQRLQKRFGG